jgi:tryptophanyl-tRNA synthetase
MSKSDPSDQSRINLNDDADTIALKIRRAKTDPEPLPGDVAGLAGRPEAANLVGIYAAMTGQTTPAVLREFAGSGFGPFKEKLAEVLIAQITPIREQTERLLNDPAHIDSILQAGGRRAAAIADPIVDEAERIVGFLPRGT